MSRRWRERRARHHACVADLLAVKPSPTNEKWWDRYKADRRYNGIKWCGASGGFQEVTRLMSTGWPEGLRKIERGLSALVPTRVASIRRKRVRKGFGDFVDMQRVYSGDIEHAWTTTERTLQKGMGRVTVTVLLNLGANHKVKAESLFWRGAAAATLVRVLEESGRRVRVIAYSVVNQAYKRSHDDQVSVDTVIIKESQDVLDLEKLASCTALAGFLRFHIFKARVSADIATKGSLGATVNFQSGRLDADDLEAMPESLAALAGDAGTINIDNIFSQAEAQAFIDEQAQAFNNAEPLTVAVRT